MGNNCSDNYSYTACSIFIIIIVMNISSLKEDLNIEKRISVTPDIAKKYIESGFKVMLPNNYGLHLGYDDEDYRKIGVEIKKDEKELILSSDIIIQVSLPSNEKI